MTLAFREKDRGIDDEVPGLVKTCQAELLSDKIAHHEWENRFKIMLVKRLGPSLVPAEVVVPLASLGAVMAEVERKVTQPVVKEGLVIRRRRRGQARSGHPRASSPATNASSLQLRLRPVADHHEDRRESTAAGPTLPGSTSPARPAEILGPERLRALEGIQSASWIPSSIMNPGKVIPGRAHGQRPQPGQPPRADDPALREPRKSARSASGRQAGPGYPGGRRLVRLHLLPVRLLRGRMRPVLRPRLGEPESPGQMVLAARVHGRAGEVEPEDGGHLPGLHDLRDVRPALLGILPDRAVLDEAAGPADRREEEDDLPALRDDGRGAASPRETSGPATGRTAWTGSRKI